MEKKNFIDYNFYEIYRCFDKTDKDTYGNIEEEWFAEFKEISRGILKGKTSSFYTDERLVHTYSMLLMLRDYMHFSDIKVPERNLFDIYINTFNVFPKNKNSSNINIRNFETEIDFFDYRSKSIEEDIEYRIKPEVLEIFETAEEVIQKFENAWYNETEIVSKGLIRHDSNYSESMLMECYFSLLMIRESMTRRKIEKPKRDTMKLLYNVYVNKE